MVYSTVCMTLGRPMICAMCAGWGGVGLGRVGVTCAQNRIRCVFLAFGRENGSCGLCACRTVSQQTGSRCQIRARPARLKWPWGQAARSLRRRGEGEQRSWDVGAKVRGHQHHWPLSDMTSYDELLLRVSRTLTHNRMEVEYEYYVVVVYLHPSSLFAKGKKGYSLEKA